MNPTPKQSLIERSIIWIIDARGDSYGDERERLRYYEAHSAILTVQTYLMPVVAATIISIAGRSAVVPVVVLITIPALLANLSLFYLRKEGVFLVRNTLRKPLRILVYSIAYATLPIAIIFTYRPNSSFLIGMVSGLVMSVLVLLRRARKEIQA